MRQLVWRSQFGTSHYVTILLPHMSSLFTFCHVISHNYTSHYVTSCCIMLHLIMSRIVMLYHVMSRYYTSRYIMCHQSMSDDITWCHVVLIISCFVTLHHVMSLHVTSNHVTLYHVMSQYVTLWHVASCYVKSCHVLSLQVTVCHILPCMLPMLCYVTSPHMSRYVTEVKLFKSRHVRELKQASIDLWIHMHKTNSTLSGQILCLTRSSTLTSSLCGPRGPLLCLY